MCTTTPQPYKMLDKYEGLVVAEPTRLLQPKPKESLPHIQR